MALIPMSRYLKIGLVSLAFMSILSRYASGAPQIDITRISLEELIAIQVVSASKSEDPFFRVPAALFVLTAEDIRRSGARNVPDILRIIPGVQVANLDGNKWAVSIRGFATRTANKLLVLIDGRSIYDPFFGGVFWEANDVMLENIERIEVIRGPGGTQWGVNAVNGVINIITKHAHDTQGTYVETGGGNIESGFIDARQGWRSSGGTASRVFAKYTHREPSPQNSNAQDEYKMARAGFRTDSTLASNNALTIKGNTYEGSADEFGPSGPREVNHRGYNLLAKLDLSPNDDKKQNWLQANYDWFEVDHYFLKEKRHTYAMEYQERVRLGTGRHTLNWGAEYRYTADRITPALLDVMQDRRSDETYSVRLVDEIWLVPDRHKLDIGSKVERNDYSGTEIQPSIHYAWYPNTAHTLWASIARTARAPTRAETSIITPNARGNPDFNSELLTAYQVGYRLLPRPDLFIDTAIFFNDYSRLTTIDNGIFTNNMQGDAHGFELAVRATPTPAWRMDFTYSYLDLNLELAAGGTDNNRRRTTQGGAPRHQASYHNGWQTSPHTRVDLTLRYVDELPALNVDAYTVADLRLGWRLSSRVEWVLAGRNLFHGPHYEQPGIAATRVAPSGFVELILQL